MEYIKLFTSKDTLGIDRKTLRTFCEECGIPIEKIIINNEEKAVNRIDVSMINSKYLPYILLYTLCTKVIGVVPFEGINITTRSKFTDFCKKYVQHDDYKGFMKIVESMIVDAYYDIKRIKEMVNLNNLKECQDYCKKLNDVAISFKMDSVVVFDTSALLNRPTILNDVMNRFRYITIPRIVIDELDKLKDTGSNSVKKLASLILNNIKSYGVRIKIYPRVYIDGNNDDEILKIASMQKSDNVYLLTNDVTFSIKSLELNNVTVLKLKDYDELFIDTKDGVYDIEQTNLFLQNIETKNSKGLEGMNLSKVDINRVVSNGFPPITVAVRNRDYRLVKALISDNRLDLNKIDEHKYRLTPIAHAVLTKQFHMVKLLVEHGADFNKGGKGKNFNNTPLMIASWNGSVDIVRYLIGLKGICINQVDSNGYTPLMKAVIQCKFEVVKLLLQHNADIYIRSMGEKNVLDYAKENALKHGKKYINAIKILDLLKEYDK